MISRSQDVTNGRNWILRRHTSTLSGLPFLHILVDLGLRIFKLAGFSFSSCGDGVISIFHHPSFTCKVGLAKMCRLMVWHNRCYEYTTNTNQSPLSNRSCERRKGITEGLGFRVRLSQLGGQSMWYRKLLVFLFVLHCTFFPLLCLYLYWCNFSETLGINMTLSPHFISSCNIHVNRCIGLLCTNCCFLIFHGDSFGGFDCSRRVALILYGGDVLEESFVSIVTVILNS